MQRVQTYVFDQIVQPTELNDIQDRAADARSLPGLILGGTTLSCPDGQDINISAIRALIMGQVGAYVSSQSPFVPWDNGLTPAKWHYIYLSHSGSALAIDVIEDDGTASTRPDSSRVFCGSASSPFYNATYRYLGCFRTWDDSGDTRPLPFEAVNGRYTYRQSAVPNKFEFSGLNSTSYADLDLSSLVPPHARTVRLFVEPAAGQSINLRTNGDTADAYSINVKSYIELVVDTSQRIEYLVSGGSAIVNVVGFDE